MGIINGLKVGYKTLMLHHLLRLCDDDTAYAQARVAVTRMRNGTAGIEYGNKATVLDAILLLLEVWDSPDSKYCQELSVARCWRKADCLPADLTMEAEDHVDESRAGSRLDPDDLANLCATMSALCTNKNKHAPALADSFVDDERRCTDEEMASALATWCNIEENKEVMAAEVEEVMDDEHDRIIKAVGTAAAAASEDADGECVVGEDTGGEGAVGEEADDGNQEDVANPSDDPADAHAEVPVPVVTQEECYDALTMVANFAKTKLSPDMLFQVTRLENNIRRALASKATHKQITLERFVTR